MIITLLFALALGPAERVRSADCLSCHDLGPRSHRIGVEVRNAPPEMLVDGRIECTTCHVSHERDTADPFRLRAEPAQLCVTCHRME